jgi:hypothetical protein
MCDLTNIVIKRIKEESIMMKNATTTCDETFKKLLFITKEYKKMRAELERIANITIQQHEQMKQQQFTIENMQLYINKQQQEMTELKQQVKMERELCEDAIRFQQTRKEMFFSNSTGGEDDIDLLHQQSMNGDVMDKKSINEIEMLLQEKQDMYHLLVLSGEDTDRQEDELRELNTEDQVSLLKRENSKLRSQYTQLQSQFHNLSQIQKSMEISSSLSNSARGNSSNGTMEIIQ